MPGSHGHVLKRPWPKFQNNHGQMVKILTMTTAKIHIFHGQNGHPKILPRTLTTEIPILTMTMAEIRISYGQNGQNEDLTTSGSNNI